MYKDVIQTVEDLTASYTDDFLSELMLFIDQMEPHDILAVMTLVVVFSLLAFNYGYKYGKDGKFKFGHVSVQLALMIIIWIADTHALDAAARPALATQGQCGTSRACSGRSLLVNFYYCCTPGFVYKAGNTRKAAFVFTFIDMLC